MIHERVNGRIVTDANVLQAVVGAVMSKKGRGALKEVIGKLNVEARLIPELTDEE